MAFRCCELLSIVHTVTILSVALCVICSLLYMMLMETYSSMGLVIALYVASIVRWECGFDYL